MKTLLKKLLPALAATVIASYATTTYGLTIVPTFDVSITTNANVVGITNAINGAIRVLQSNLLDNVTVNITFVADETVGLGQSTTYGEDVSYTSFLTALRSHATSSRDTNALSKLPVSATDPVIGGSQIHLTTAQARMLGLDTYSGSDSTIACKMSLMNFTRPPQNVNKYDLQQVLEHEMDEVLGISSGLPDTSEVWPADLFRYTTNLARTFTTTGDNAYFSTDGTNLLARFNMDPGGDYGDWWSVNYPTNWSSVAGIVTTNPQVQDAFSGPGNTLDLGTAEMAILDVVGWKLASSAPIVSPAVKIARTGLNQYTLSWTNTASGFVLQERTNLISGSWVFSLSGSTNPAAITSTNRAKFYRLYNPASSSTQPAPVVTGPTAATGPLTITVRNLQPRQP